MDPRKSSMLASKLSSLGKSNLSSLERGGADGNGDKQKDDPYDFTYACGLLLINSLDKHFIEVRFSLVQTLEL